METDIAEIKEKLKQMRAENRLVATENRKLIAQIKQLELDIDVLKKNADEQTGQLAANIQRVTKQIDTEVAQRANTRKEKKKMILAQIQQKTEENKVLSNQIRSIENEIIRTKQIQDTYSSRIVKRKLQQKP